MNEDPSDETSENDTMGGPAHDAPKATSARALCEIAGNPSALDSGDLFGAAKNAIKGWAELTDTTHPRAFARMNAAIEKLCDAIEEHEAAEAGRVVDAMTPKQVDAYLVSMGVNLEEMRAHTEEMRAKIETKLGKPDALAQARCGLADAKLTIEWQANKLEDARRVLERVAKHADFSQCPDGVEEEVDAALSSLNVGSQRTRPAMPDHQPTEAPTQDARPGWL